MIEKVKMFLAICVEGSSLKAAKSLYITQPAVSQGIKKLESVLEVKLFERKGRNLTLSASGIKFVPYAQQYIKLHESTLSAFKASNMQLTIGSSMTIANTILPELINSFESVFPIKFKVYVNNARSIKEMLENNTIDIAFIEGEAESEKYIYYVLDKFHLKFVATPNYLTNNDQRLDNKQFDFLVREPGSSYRNQFDDFCIKNNILITPKWECSTNEIIKYTTLNHQGVALLPIELISHYLESGELVIVNLNKLSLVETYGIVVNKLRIEEYSITSFVDFILDKEQSNHGMP